MPDCCNFDRPTCPFEGQSEAEHCTAGRHCVSQYADCAAARNVDDHPDRCCFCDTPWWSR